MMTLGVRDLSGAVKCHREGVGFPWMESPPEAEVDAVLAQAQKAGAVSVKPGRKVFWGGYSGHFKDADGH